MKEPQVLTMRSVMKGSENSFMTLRIFIFQKVRAGGADIILDCLSHKTKTASVFKGTHSPQGLLYTFFVIPMDIAVKLPYEFFK